jgi:LDH2 family malate/lactate/ureidoglycolate dehydrogenase
VPYGGARARLGTNPLCFGVPAGGLAGVDGINLDETTWQQLVGLGGR